MVEHVLEWLKQYNSSFNTRNVIKAAIEEMVQQEEELEKKYAFKDNKIDKKRLLETVSF